MKFLVIGSGEIALRHSSNIKKIIPESIIYLHANKKRFTKEKKEKFSVVSQFIFSEKELNKISPDAVIICSPSTKHLKQALLFAEKGISLFIEKPLSNSLNGIDDLVEIVKEKGIISMVGYVLRFNKALIAFKDILNENKYGSVIRIESVASSYLPSWRPNLDYTRSVSANRSLGGGVILELSHEIDYLRWIFGEPDIIYEHSDKISKLDIDTEDYAFYLMKFKNSSNEEILCELKLDFHTQRNLRKCEVVLEKGLLIWDGIKNNVIFSNFSKQEVLFQGKEEDMYYDQINHFIESLRQNIDTEINIHEATKTLKVILENRKIGR